MDLQSNISCAVVFLFFFVMRKEQQRPGYYFPLFHVFAAQGLLLCFVSSDFRVTH